MAVDHLTSIILAIVCCASPVFSVCTWTEWTTCSVDCGISQGSRTRDPSADCNNCGPIPAIPAPCSRETESPCGVRCGCDTLPCNIGVNGIACDQIGTNPRTYSCICQPGYAGNQSQDCNTALGSTDGASYEVTSSTPQTLTSPFYPDMYPLLLQATWTVYTTVGNTLLVTFDHFNLATATTTDCIADYTVMRNDATTGLIQTLTDAQVTSVCPCIYDMLIVYDGNTTDIANITNTYCNDTSPPSTLTSSGNVLTFEMRTDYTSDTTTNPGFSITVSQTSTPTSTSASNTVSITQSTASNTVSSTQSTISSTTNAAGNTESSTPTSTSASNAVSSTQSTISSTTDGTEGGFEAQGGANTNVLVPSILVPIVAVTLVGAAAGVGYYVWNKKKTSDKMAVTDDGGDKTIYANDTPAPQTGTTNEVDGLSGTVSAPPASTLYYNFEEGRPKTAYRPPNKLAPLETKQ